MNQNTSEEVDWAYSVLDDPASLSLESLWSGNLSIVNEIRRTESVCTLLGSPAEKSDADATTVITRFVVKGYLRDTDVSQNRHVREFDGLMALHAGVCGSTSTIAGTTFRATAPQPLAISFEPAAVLMSAVPGQALDEWLETENLSSDQRKALTRTVIRGLIGFYAHSIDPHGDFHLGNLMIARDESGDAWTISFLDPGRSRALLRKQTETATFGLMSVDMGYLLSFAGPTSPSRYLRQFSWVLRRLAVSVHVVLMAQDEIDNSRGFRKEVVRFAHQQITATTDTWPPKAMAVQLGKRLFVEYGRLRLVVHRKPRG